MTTISAQDAPDRRRARRLFIVLLLLTAGLQVFLIAGGRLGRGHSPAGHPGSLLSPLGLLTDDLLLLVGSWMLARRLFTSPLTAFFIGVSAIGSAFALDDDGRQVHSIAALPLLLFLLHGVIDQGSRIRLFLAGTLAAVQALAGPPGSGFVAPIAAALYVAGRAFLLREPLGERWRAGGWSRRDLLWAAAALVGWVPVLLTAGGARSGTSAASVAGLRDTLVYAGLSNPLRYLDFLIGATPSLDWSLYSGALTLGFAVVAILSGPRATVLRLAGLLPCGLIALGAALSLIFLAAPSLRPQTAAAYGTPLVRLLLCFMGGAGLQRVLLEKLPRPLLGAGRFLLIGSVFLAFLAWTAAMHSDRFRDLLGLLVAGESSTATASAALQPWDYLGHRVPLVASDLVGMSAVTAGLAGAILLAWGRRPRIAPFALALILFLHPLDVFSWKFRMSWLETSAAGHGHARREDLRPWAHAPTGERP